MLDKIIQYSIHHKLIVLLFSLALVVFGIYSLSQIPIGAVPDVTNNQVQIITTSRNLATEDIEKFITYPIELEMANLPGVKEIRSISKFGLSVVTIVFEDKMGTYLPRQLIAEKIKSAEEKIPAGFGKPFMGPISTGLGEIYQYTIEVDSQFRDVYSLAEIRTIQDWQVKRQLSGIPGVVEVNTWGGYLKQYEVAINPEKLRSLNISVSQVFKVLEENNSVAGGGYIEKLNQAYFIRGEGLVNSKEDIENIVVENREGIPLMIKDVAAVGFGHATRFGAITGNAEGEKVLGQVMMLKGANSKAVIEAVKARVAEISPNLPPGISINGFLERSELIEKTSFTIAENLILGCLIVIFVVVLLLGNLRSGLVVASVIPMCLLFALSLMYLFDVDANLMSLGAIDFGIIIDGAVIIVEYIAYKITKERLSLSSLSTSEKQKHIDKLSFEGASKMMHSAVFGQLIIIIVFIPILSLVGVEGKMFRPMALVFSFALIGAMLLCFTYVPVMASLFIKPSDPDKKTISNRLISFLEQRYELAITWALKSKKMVISIAVGLLLASALLFSQMGGEFVPTLDEGDFVIQPVLKTGTSLKNTVKATTQIESILKSFPEVLQVVSRIGAAEVPTDPMSMEESDVIIKLKPVKEWVTAKNKDELADKFKEALGVMPGIDFEFTQPIEMRFNELITGVRADLAIKVFGEDLDVLSEKALEIEKAIKNIEGAADISVEKIAGLPQMSVKYDRQKIAKYGLNIQDLNEIIQIGFAGATAGTVFEGEKQFDLVLRFDENHSQNLDDLASASILLDSGISLPLSEFAEIGYNKGPAKISRDNTKRRIVVGVNVRNRDLESVVLDVQNAIAQKISLPTGYTIEYGGQFENLRTAKDRLKIAVPIALILIFILLYFAFNSVKEALIIYSAIPLSIIGGIALLYFRDLPFSISAGVGFIALFGIAVLNGIVLIEEFKDLKSKGIIDMHERIITGTKKRLRPVLLTALAAALGFLPMAISTSAGAEVQRPLATVVVGGLISATLLTLLVLPVLYSIFDRRNSGIKIKARTISILIFILAIPTIGISQSNKISLDEAVQLALEHNHSLQAASMRIEQSEQLSGSAFDLEKTELQYGFDENNIAPNNLPLKVWGISQSISFPTVYSAKKKVMKGEVSLIEDQFYLDKQDLILQVSTAYCELVYWTQSRIVYSQLDSLYKQFTTAANRKFELGDSNALEKLSAQNKSLEIKMQLHQIQEQIEKAKINLNKWIQQNEDFNINISKYGKLTLNNFDQTNHPGIKYYTDAQELSQFSLKLEKQKLLPDLQFSAYQGRNNGEGVQTFNGYQAGIAIPLFFGAQKSRIQAAKTAQVIIDHEFENYRIQLQAKYESLISDIKRNEEAVLLYESSGKDLSNQLRFHANKSFANGEINFLEYVLIVENSKSIELNYLKSLLDYNSSIIQANHLIH